MRPNTRLLTLFVVLGFAACRDNEPTAPLSPSRQFAPAASLSGAVQGWERVTIFNDHTFFVPCMNEDMRFYGWVPYQYHEVATPSGGFDFNLQYRPETPNSPVFVAEGLTSGKVFTYSNGRPVNVSFHLAAGEVQTVVSNELYVAADGSKLFGDSRFHYTVNANGELTGLTNVEYEITCGSK